MLYVFIFIALRSLRFEARYVILAGAAAALGWLMLVGYAIYDEGGMSVITRDYVAYMTSALVLLGAEFDKVISILVVTLILAATIVRARNLLVRSVADNAAKSQLSRFFAPEIATRIAESEQDIAPGQGVTREAAIMMVDIRSFTIMAEKMGATDLIGLLAEYQSRMVPAIQAESGAIDKFLGDGIMATFGAALPSETFAADALRAADAVAAAAASGIGREPPRALIPSRSVSASIAGRWCSARLAMAAGWNSLSSAMPSTPPPSWKSRRVSKAYARW